MRFPWFVDFPGYHEQARQKGYRDYHHWWNASPEADALKRRVRAKLPAVCWCCGGYDRLQLHHMRYTIMGEEPHTDFKLLCQECHTVCEKMIRTGVIARAEAHVHRRFQIRWQQAQAVKKRAA